MPVSFITIDVFLCVGLHVSSYWYWSGICVHVVRSLRKCVYKMQTNPPSWVRLHSGFCAVGSGPHCAPISYSRAEYAQLVEQEKHPLTRSCWEELLPTRSTINGRDFMQTVRKVFMRPRM